MPEEPDKRVQSRAESLLPEEQEAGSDDPAKQAEEILAESDARSDGRAAPFEKPIERRPSEDTVEPVE